MYRRVKNMVFLVGLSNARSAYQADSVLLNTGI